MGILSRFKSTAGPSTEERHVAFDWSQTMKYPDDFLDYQVGMWGGLEDRIALVRRCIDITANTIAMMPLRVNRAGVPVKNPAWVKNPDPNTYTHIGEAIEAVMRSLLYRGNAYLLTLTRNFEGYPHSWTVLNPDLVSITWDATTAGVIEYNIAGERVSRSDILHIRSNTRPGDPYGHSPLEAAGAAISSAYLADEHSKGLSKRKGIPQAVLKHDAAKLSKAETTKLQSDWDAAVQTGLPPVLSGGLSFDVIELTPQELDMIASRNFDDRRIATVFGVPLWLVNLPQESSLTYATVEGQFAFWYETSLLPYVMNMQRALDTFMPAEWNLSFDADILTEPTALGRASVYEKLIALNIMTPEEARVLERMPPFDEGKIADLKILGEETGQGVKSVQ